MAGIFSVIKQIFSDAPQPVKAETQAEKQARHRNNALEFAKQKHQEAGYTQRSQDAWQQRYGKQKAAELNQLSGTQFEEYLAGLFQQLGYVVPESVFALT